MRTQSWMVRGQILVASFASAVAYAVTAVPVASADYLEPSVTPDAPAGPGMGHVSISTLPGKQVVVNVVGRTDALGTDGPFSNGCEVSLGAHVTTQFIRLDDTGSGSATLVASPDTDSTGLSGKCGTHQPRGAGRDDNLNLLAAHAPLCPNCSTRGWVVHFDGGAPVVGPDYPKPAPTNGQSGGDCNAEMRQSFDRYGMSADMADLGMALAKSPQLELAKKAYAACALVANSPDEAFRALCNVGRSMIPADWAYLAISQLGKSISNDQIESFGQSASNSWNAQCR